ncbi:CHAT domain-containing protein [Aspergillus granulosus]|uniref:CHAT domain-containing protein n=1 Tax=Aspergillus granulosus TaxID=176169 RepID=A0ABR4HX44_9EURO
MTPKRPDAIPERHPGRATCLIKLGDGVAAPYSIERLPADLEDAIRFLQQAINLIPDDQPIPVPYLDGLARRLDEKYPGTAHVHPSYAHRLQNWCDWLRDRYSKTQDMRDLEQSINIGQIVIRATTDEHRGRVAYLNSLATALSYRYEKTQSMADLEQSIYLLKRALGLTKDKDPNRALLLSNLSLQIRDRYSSTGEVDDLNESIDLIQDAIDLTDQGNTNRPVYLHNLSIRLSDRYETLGSMDDLERSIVAAQAATDSTGDGHPNRSLYLHNLGLRLDDRYSKTERRADLERAIEAALESIRGLPPTDPDFLGRLYILNERRQKHRQRFPVTTSADEINAAAERANGLEQAHSLNRFSSRLGSAYARTGEVAALEISIQAAERAVDVMPPDHPDYPGMLSNLSIRLGNRYDRNGSIDDLERCIELTRKAVNLAPNDGRERPGHLVNLGLHLGERYTKLGDLADLEDSIALIQEAVDTSAHDHPRRALFLVSLGLQLGDRFDTTGATGDLDRSIQLAQEAVNLTPSGNADHIGRIYNLSMLLCKRYAHMGVIADLEKSIQIAREVIDATPSDHTRQPVYLTSLGQRLSDRYQRLGLMADLDESIQAVRKGLSLTPDHHTARAERLCELSTLLRSRYSRTGEVSDLEESIQLASEGVRITPSHEKKRPVFLNGLGCALGDRYLRSGMMADLEESIRVHQEGVDTTPDGHVELPIYLYNLGARLGERYLRKEAISDLQASIRVIQKAVDTTPEDNINWASYSNGLGNRLYDRYVRTGAEDDLEQAIKIERRIIDATPQGHTNRPQYLDTLNVYLIHRYRSQRRAADLEECIELGRETLRITPEDHPDRSAYLQRLGGRLGPQSAGSVTTVQFEEAISCYQAALSQQNSPTLSRLEAGREILLYYAIASRWKEAYDAAHLIMELIPRLTLRAQDHSDRQYLMGQVAGLASDTAAVALRATMEPSLALGFLEQGRGVIASSLEDVRADIALLSEKHPHLAQRFESARSALESRSTVVEETMEAAGSRRYEAGKLFDELIGDIRREPGFENFLRAPDGDELRAAAAHGTIVVINVSKYLCDAMIVEQHRIWSLTLPDLDMEEIQRKADKYYLEGSEVLEWLWDVVMNPILEALGYTQPPSNGDWPHVWWIPTGPLSQYPLHAAGYHGKGSTHATVLDRVVSSYSTSVRAILNGRRREYASPRTPSQALLVAMEETPGHSRLSFAAKETAILRSLLADMNITPIEPGQRKADIISHLPQCTIFHFSGHGSSHPYDPSKSRLLLEDWKRDPLEVANLLEIDIRRYSPFLAYLSACGTGQVRSVKYMDESIHLISAFQLAGFRHAIGTLWEVSDELCVDMARITFEYIRDGGATDRSVAWGLHMATRALRDRCLNTPKVVTLRRSNKVDDRDRDGRDAELCDDDDIEARVSLHWVPYVHFGV